MSDLIPELFQDFADAMPFGACLVDLQGKILYWNAAAEGITGYHRHDVLGRPYRGDLLVQPAPEASGASTKCPVLEVLRDGTSVAADLFLRHKAGHRLPLRVFAFPLRNPDGHLRAVGEIFEPAQPRQESSAWLGHSDREFEMATGLPAVEESRDQLRLLLLSRSAASSALLLIEMTEHDSILQHGGAPMLHQAIRVLARTVAGLLPARNFVGCWNDWRLLAIVPECNAQRLEQLRATLAQVGSSCALKWWGDRVTIGMRLAARIVDPAANSESLIHLLELELKQAADRKG
jgi:PAS domain S-box-containing protein